MISVDGDTSTNDMVSVLANGAAGNPPIQEEGPDFDCFCQALRQVNLYLCRAIAKDGEGATKLIECAVTEADYAAFARATPGLRVMQAGAIAGFDPDRPMRAPRCVTVAVLPYSAGPRPMPDADFLQKVQAQLERVRPVCTYVKAVAPLYIRIDISVTLLVRAGAGNVEESVRRALEACFRSDEKGWRLGSRITEGEIAGAIGQAEGVLGVKNLQMNAESARAGRSAAGDILLPPHALPELGALEVYR